MPSAPRSRPDLVLTVVLVSVVMAVAILSSAPSTITAHSSVPFTPDDPGCGGTPAGWARVQWNFAGAYGIRAPQAWGNVAASGAPGASGVVVAVLDTGVAYPGSRSGPGSPDLRRTRFVPGHDFVDGDDDPFDENGHGTHVASTIAEQTDNSMGLAGLAYGAALMPVRVLDRRGGGDALTIARGIRFAARHGAQVINLSLNFEASVTEAEIPTLLSAVADARRQGALVVAGAGNNGEPAATFPARDPSVVAVGATTEHGCLADYSNYGDGIDVVAPGGGDDANVSGDPHCRHARSGAPISQMTVRPRMPGGYAITGWIGTSMAAPHVSATAALVIAGGVLGPDPSPDAVRRRLESTARDLGVPGYDHLYGWGLIDAAAATGRS
jgi:serine protease